MRPLGMERYSILDHTGAAAAPALAPDPAPAVPATPVPDVAAPALRFPAEDGGQSLGEMARRDLYATLQLLTERAQYITGASGAAIALRDHGELICRATTGSSAPELGAQLQVNSGLTGESVRTRQVLRCDDAATDPRVNQESCRALDIASVVVMPLIRGKGVFGVFELLSNRPHAFEERDILAVQRLVEMIHTALDHAQAAQFAQQGLTEDDLHPEKVDAGVASASIVMAAVEEKPSAEPANTSPLPVPPPTDGKHDDAEAAEEVVSAGANPLFPDATRSIRRCEKCGFPVSEGRTLCLDCEAALPKSPAQAPIQTPIAPPAFLQDFGAPRNQRGWLHNNIYTIGIVVMAALTAALLFLHR